MPTTKEIHEIIITGDPKRLQDIEKEYSNSLKRMENLDRVETAKKLAGVKLAARETLDQIAQERKARTDAAREIAATQKSQFGLTGDMSQITSWRELLLATKNAKSAVIEFGAATKMVGSDKTYGAWLNELAEKKRVITRTTKLTSEQLLGLSRDLTVVGLGARSLVSDIGDLTSGDKSMGELAMGISGVSLQAVTLIPFLHGMGREMQAMGIISSATVTSVTKLAGGLAQITGYAAAAAGQLYAFKVIIDQTGAVVSSLVNILGSHSWQEVTDNFYAMGQALSDLNPILDIIGFKFNFLKDQALDASTAIQGVLAKEPTAEGSRRSTETAPVTHTGTRTSPRTSTEKELVSLYDQEQKKLVELQKELILNAGYIGAELETKKKILEIEERLYFLRTGIDLHKFAGFQPLTVSWDMITKDIMGNDIKHKTAIASPTEDFLKAWQEKMAAEQQTNQQNLDTFGRIRGYSEELLGIFGALPPIAEDLKNIFFNIIQGILSQGQGGGLFGFLSNIIWTAASGGAGGAMGAVASLGGMPSGNHFLRGAAGSMKPVINVVVHSEVERTKAINFYNSTFPEWDNYQSKK